MIHNSKTFVKALLVPDQYSQVLLLSQLKSGKEYFKSFLNTTDLLLRCRNKRFLNDTDRKDIERHKGTLEREHVSYLLGVDE